MLNNRSYQKTDVKYAVVPLIDIIRDFIGDNIIVLSRDGKVVMLNGVKLKISKNSIGYMRVHFNGRDYQLATLMALAWLGVPTYTSEHWLVNHIDGNKSNNHIDNLEWSNYRDNIIHAYRTGLRKDNRVIQLKDLISGEETEFYSLKECSRYLSVNSSLVHEYLKDKHKIRNG